MNAADFEILYNLVASREEGWEESLVIAWPCLTQFQKEILDVL